MKQDEEDSGEVVESRAVSVVRREAWVALAAGLIAAVVLIAFPFSRWLLHFFSVLVHEFGHALFGWLFGYPSIPSFDFSHASGVTLWTGRSTILLVALHLGCISLIVMAIRKRGIALALIPIAAVWALLAHIRFHDAVIVYMGHGMELAIAGIFLYRAMTGVALEREYERPIYSMLACYLIVNNVLFSISLITDQGARYLYENDARQVVNDFKHIAYFHLGNVDISVVAYFHIFACLLVAALTIFCVRFVRFH